jgi:DNA-binding response OmpR family regulator
MYVVTPSADKSSVKCRVASVTVLLVDDDPVFRAECRACLSREGFSVSEATTGGEGLRLASTARFDLIVLEMNLAGLDGTTLCRKIRSDSANRVSGILFASSRSNEGDKIDAFTSGADDYVAKPVAWNEFVARVQAVLRRSRYAASDPARPARGAVRPRELIIDAARRRVAIRGSEIALTRQEFDLLQILSSHPGIVFSRQALLAKLPRIQSRVTERTIDAIVTRVRQKLGEDSRNPQFILTAWGLGYKFADVADG